MSKNGVKELGKKHASKADLMNQEIMFLRSYLEVQRYVNAFILECLDDKAISVDSDEVKVLVRLNDKLSLVTMNDNENVVKVAKVIVKEKEEANDTSGSEQEDRGVIKEAPLA